MTTDFSSAFFSTLEMDRVFSTANQLRQMTRFEWALCSAMEDAGIAAKGSSGAVGALLDTEFVDRTQLLSEARLAGNLAIPFLRQLTAAVGERNPEAAGMIHLGATSQDVLDTALVLQSRDALALILDSVTRLDGALTRHAHIHAGTVLAGRTWLQQGSPTTLGLKIAGWIDALRRHRQRLQAARERVLVVQFGGAVGTLGALGDRGAEVSLLLARKLELAEPNLPWHTHRDRFVEIAAVMGMLVGALGKMARDVSLLMQTEVGEVLEPAGEGRGGSSAMPHKRNPVASAMILAAAARVPGLVATMMGAMAQEHERGLGNWQAEWETYPEIFRLAAAALERAIEIADGMVVRPGRMAENLASTGGLAFTEDVSAALAGRMGREMAHSLVEKAAHDAVERGQTLREALLATPEVRAHFDEAAIDRLLDPGNSPGSARRFVHRVIGDDDAVR